MSDGMVVCGACGVAHPASSEAPCAACCDERDSILQRKARAEGAAEERGKISTEIATFKAGRSGPRYRSNTSLLLIGRWEGEQAGLSRALAIIDARSAQPKCITAMVEDCQVRGCPRHDPPKSGTPSPEVEALRAELASTKEALKWQREHTEALDKNWAALYEGMSNRRVAVERELESTKEALRLAMAEKRVQPQKTEIHYLGNVVADLRTRPNGLDNLPKSQEDDGVDPNA